jgi:hypothetical protein
MAGRKTQAAKAAASTASTNVRKRLADDLEKRYDLLLKVLEKGLETTKKARGWCPHCGKQVWVEIQDTNAAMKAAEFLANQGLGRPGEDQTKQEATFTVIRSVVPPSETE